MIKTITAWANYQIELLSQLLVTVAVAFCYGHIECKYIATGTASFAPLPGIFHRWSYYHLWMVGMLAISSFSLAMAHIQWMNKGRWNYVWLICLANALAAPTLEDIAWFITAGRGIRYDDWTMIRPGWGLDFGHTYIPVWYLVTIAVCVTLYWLASRAATKAYRDYVSLEGTA